LAGEEKDHDRLRWSQDLLLGCVCDGVGTSPCAAEAAEHVVRNINALLSSPTADPNPHLLRVCGELLGYREALQGRPIIFPDAVSPALWPLLTEAVEAKRLKAYQTTFVALRIFPRANEDHLVRLGWCGDTGLFSFDSDGQLYWSNLAKSSDWKEKSVVTDSLPDAVDRVIWRDFTLRDSDDDLKERQFLPPHAEFLMATDGFYSAFTDFAEVTEWLRANRQKFQAEDSRDQLFHNLHEMLALTSGDDDISFIWITPEL
jgi:serine/threonine protein phosphatase PrpC